MEHRAVLENTLSSFEPQSVADLKAMGLLDTVKGLPRYRTLFVIQDNKLHVLHRSIAEASKEFGVDVRRGHATLAAYTADAVAGYGVLVGFSQRSTDQPLQSQICSGSSERGGALGLHL